MVNFGRQAIERAITLRVADDYESLAFLRYWVGMADLKQGNITEGIAHLEQLIDTIDLNDRTRNAQSKALSEEIGSLKTSAAVLLLILSPIVGGPLAFLGGLAMSVLPPEFFVSSTKYHSAYAIKLNRLLDQDEQLEYFYELGRAYEQLGAHEKAVDHYKEAIAIIEQQRATIGSETQRISFLEDRQAPYQRIVLS